MAKQKSAPTLPQIRKQVRKYDRVKGRYKALAVTLRTILEKAVPRYAPLAIVQARPKSVSSFAEKITRKWKGLETDDPATEFTDLCGARVIALTRSHVDAMRAFVRDHFDIDEKNSEDAAQRLKPSEFGYRSVHLIVSLRRGEFPSKLVPVDIAEDLYPDDDCPMKAEIQLRTTMEHAYGDMSHDLTYKGSFEIPVKWQRQISGVAASVETTSDEIERIVDGLRYYAANYGEALTLEETRAEIAELKTVLKFDKGNSALADRIARLAITLGDWDEAMSVLRYHLKSGNPNVWREYGIALTKKHRHRGDPKQYELGQQYLEKAAQPEHGDAEAMAAYASSWRKTRNQGKVREWYRKAYEADPRNSYALSNLLEMEIADRKDLSIVPLMRPAIEEAARRCLDQTEVGMNVPWGYYNAAMFECLLGQDDQGIRCLAKAIECSNARFMLESACRSTARLEVIRPRVLWLKACCRLLAAGAAAKHIAHSWGTRPGKVADCDVLRPSPRNPFAGHDGPIVILAGGCRGASASIVAKYRAMLLEAFEGYPGLVVSGGTLSGIAEVAGDIAAANRRRTTAIGYRPGQLGGNRIDKRYRRRITTDGETFSALEPLQYWHDILAAGIDPRTVKLVGMGGGPIAAIEYRIALALGAKVAILPESGAEATRLLSDPHWNACRNLIQVPEEMLTLRYLVMPPSPRLREKIRDTVAEAIHETYRREQQFNADPDDRAMKPWSELAGDLKESNRGQADDMAAKLTVIKCHIARARGREPASTTFKTGEIDRMARMEHGRWNAQKLLSGWRHGGTKDEISKTNPCVLRWEDLPKGEQKKDIDAINSIPRILAEVELEAQRNRGG
jgi:ppGpp synthetase/RelA/SpoT-type nucleotidyltranferase